MHHPLAEAGVLVARAGCAPSACSVKRAVWQVSQLRRRVPARDPLRLVDDVEAVAGRADRGAGAAAVAAQGDRRPRAGARSGSRASAGSRRGARGRPARPAARRRARNAVAAASAPARRVARSASACAATSASPFARHGLDEEAAVDRDRAARSAPVAVSGDSPTARQKQESSTAGAGERDDRGRLAAAEPELVAVVPAHDLVEDLQRRRRRTGARRAPPCGGNCVGTGSSVDVGLLWLPARRAARSAGGRTPSASGAAGRRRGRPRRSCAIAAVVDLAVGGARPGRSPRCRAATQVGDQRRPRSGLRDGDSCVASHRMNSCASSSW